ncbi:SbcC/MukB-like Walker B domain-containing protein, partial [Streptosporangium sandarakinum]
AALAAAVRAADVEAAHHDACAAADLTVADAVAGLEEAERALARLRESAAAEPAVAGEAGRAAAELEAARERSRELAVTLAARRTHADKLAAEAERLAARLDEARGDDPSLTHRLDRLADEAELLREAAEAAREERVTAAELEAARTRALAAVAEAGFRSADDARSAVRPPAEQEEKAARLRELDEERAAVTAMLADPELVAAAAEPEPDLDGLRRDHDAADEAHAGLRSALHGAEARRERLAVLRAELEGCLDRWLPAAERHRLTERMAALTGGNSTDNRWNMRLSSYVLGERLRQVVAAANERLDHMSGGRYLLEHNLGRSAGDRSRSGGGLGLRILDGWTGVDRDPATLSGGESFITSLALALGLADVVTAEAGGVEIGTLFVDEGFGTLDEDTLDGVLDILDGLRDGGRAVGIVSHVAELRTRVPAQLRVRKERRGSTLSVTGV